MEIKEFQKLLSELAAKTAADKQLSIEEVREYFKEASLTDEQTGAVISYLRSKADPVTFAEEEVLETDHFPGTRKPLSAEDRRFLENHIRRLDAENPSSFRLLKTAAEMAAEYHCEELSLPDLVQEASLAALTAFREDSRNLPASEASRYSSPDKTKDQETIIRQAIYEGICGAVTRQASMLQNDRYLVSRVEDLDRAIKDLTDEGESLPSFSAAELAVILDTGLDELRGILKLTGDDL